MIPFISANKEQIIENLIISLVLTYSVYLLIVLMKFLIASDYKTKNEFLLDLLIPFRLFYKVFKDEFNKLK